MKVINKILCFISVLVLCVPVLCFNVSADDSTSYDYSYLYGTDFSGKYSSFFISQLKEVSNGPFLNGSSETGKPNLCKSDYWKEDTNGLKTNYIGWVEPNTSDYYVMDNNINNVLLLAFAQSQWGYWKDNSKPIYYYCYSYVYKESDIQIHKNYDFYFSNSPLTFSTCTNSYCDYVKLNSIDSCHVSVFTYLDELDGVSYPNAYASSGLAINNSAVCGSQVTTGNEICFKSGDYGQVMIEEQYVTSSREFQFKCNLDCYSFISSFSNHDIDSSCFTSGTVYNVSDIASDKTLSNQIEVKLTPSFSVDMDRVFDKNTGQNDYFKFEVTNNSENPIQFSASIVPVGTELLEFTSLSDLNTSEAVNSGNLSDYILGEQKFVNTKALWNYLTDCEYYIINANIDYEKAYFVKNTNFYVEERKGNFYWIFVPPNTTYSDYIYWENVKITPNTHYDFVFTGLELDSTFTHSSAVFANAETLYALTDTDDESIGSIFKSNVSKPWTLFSNVNTDSSVEQYKVDLNSMVELYRTEFSVKTIPSFSNEIKGGNSAYSTGWNDTENQVDNPYYKKNLQTGEIEAVSNWSEYNGSVSDVDVNIDNVGVGDVKNLISYSQDFFTLIKSVMLSFPTWIWVLICFGLTGLIVIAIVKALL